MKKESSAPAAAGALLTEREAADRLSLSVRSLQAWRVTGGGPVYTKLGRAVRYRAADLEAFIAAGVRHHTSEGGR